MQTAVKSYTVAYPNALNLRKGTRIEILREETKSEWLGWIWCRAEDGQLGWIPQDIVAIESGVAKIVEDYDAKEVAVDQGDVIEVMREKNGWAWVRKTNGTEGWIPGYILG